MFKKDSFIANRARSPAASSRLPPRWVSRPLAIYSDCDRAGAAMCRWRMRRSIGLHRRTSFPISWIDKVDGGSPPDRFEVHPGYGFV